MSAWLVGKLHRHLKTIYSDEKPKIQKYCNTSGYIKVQKDYWYNFNNPLTFQSYE